MLLGHFRPFPPALKHVTISVLPSVICGYNQHYVTNYVFDFLSLILYFALLVF